MERIHEENKPEREVASLDEFRKQKKREESIKKFKLPPGSSDEDIENAWKKWWKEEVSFD
ncbi:MAG: hypothetical protein Q8Q22_02105 [bacterium]|nr:hypothetical protein [bacterium]MDZ4205864.1 hypothetical protein [Patescibacteria group bacterium]